MYDVASASALFSSTATTLGGAIVTVLGVTVGAWAGFLILRWALRKVRGAIR